MIHGKLVKRILDLDVVNNFGQKLGIHPIVVLSELSPPVQLSESSLFFFCFSIPEQIPSELPKDSSKIALRLLIVLLLGSLRCGTDFKIWLSRFLATK